MDKIKNWFLVFLCMGVIFYFSHQPAQDLPPLFMYQDIVFHFLSYCILAYFFSRALKHSNTALSHAKIIIFSVCFGVLYGASDELHQFFIPGRNSAFTDVMIDGLGSLSGGPLYFWSRQFHDQD